MFTQRFPIGDGREVVLTWRFSGYVDVRIDAQAIGRATRAELRKCVLFEDVDGTGIHVVCVHGVPLFPMFDVYYAGHLLPHSVGDPAWARRTVIELLVLLAIYNIGSVVEPIREQRWPSGLLEWIHIGFAAAALPIAYAAWSRVRSASAAARHFTFLWCALAALHVGSKSVSLNLDLGALGLYVWMRHATRTLEAMDTPAAPELDTAGTIPVR